MIRINLLPHREIKRAMRRRDFYVMTTLAFVAALVIVGVGWLVIDSEKSNQEGRNNFIKQENAKLDDQIKEIADLKDEIDALKARQQAVQDLQSDRNLPVHMLDEFVRQVPEGVYLTSLRQDGLKVTLTGIAQSNDRVSELLRNLGNNSPWLDAPDLVEIKSVTLNNKRLNQFTLNVTLKRPVDPVPGAVPPSGTTAVVPAAAPGAAVTAVPVAPAAKLPAKP